MSEENVETVRRAYERVNATLELSRELYDPDVEFDVGDVSATTRTSSSTWEMCRWNSG